MVAHSYNPILEGPWSSLTSHASLIGELRPMRDPTPKKVDDNSKEDILLAPGTWAYKHIHICFLIHPISLLLDFL